MMSVIFSSIVLHYNLHLPVWPQGEYILRDLTSTFCQNMRSQNETCTIRSVRDSCQTRCQCIYSGTVGVQEILFSISEIMISKILLSISIFALWIFIRAIDIHDLSLHFHDLCTVPKENVCIVIQNSQKFFAMGQNIYWIRTCNGLMPNRRGAIIWTNVDQEYQRHVAQPDQNELTHSPLGNFNKILYM